MLCLVLFIDIERLIMSSCPCQSGKNYQDCCEPLHLGVVVAENAEQLMRSRYCAFALKKIDYIIHTMAKHQQSRLNRIEFEQWLAGTNWTGLQILSHQPNLDKSHSAVSFKAFFHTEQGEQEHQERSLFVKHNDRWYFVDPTVALPNLKQNCVCGSGKKFKHCCGPWI